MEPFALALLLIAAISHAVWNAIAKSATGNPYVFVWAYLVVASALLLPITAVFLYRNGWPESAGIALAPVISGVLHVGYLLTLQTAYTKGDLGVVYPTARGVGPLLTMIVALGVIGERPQPIALAGALIVLAGILLVATGASRRVHWFNPGLLYGVATGITIASYTLWDNRAVTVWNFEPLPYFTLALTTQALLLTPFALRTRAKRQRAQALRANSWRIIAVALLWPLGYILVLTAQKTAPISIVAPVREVSIIFGALIGWLVYREERPLRRLIGASIVLIGIVLLTR